ncbi:MAG TPA: hypothetical protein H9871_10290 [Candidatus Nesterenkonia stercoripullorum]|uniref:Uncharacterized protein n=1 Tax=Candidatus Nesterenkonia stercoripullorum TaxID=2838701 RepID=A0A9D1UU70_9MICC|nr:hypothetical protein [Candidatus Nesterenkonia stercoripullorum]
MSTLSFSNTFKTITAAAVLSLSAPLTAVAVPSAETSADEIGDLDALLHNSQDDSELSAGVVNGNESLSWREGEISTSVPHNPAEMAKTTIDGQDMLEIGLLHPETVSEGVVTSNNTVIFPAQDSPDTYAMQLYDNGSLGLTAIAVTPESEGQFAYDLPSSITPVVQQTGAVALYEHDSLIGVVEHPEAYDADGNAIVTKYVDVDGDLVQVVSP